MEPVPNCCFCSISVYFVHKRQKLKKYIIFLIPSAAIYSSVFLTNAYLVNKYDADMTKIFGPTVLACSNLDIIAKNIQQNSYDEFDPRLLGDIVKLYDQSASTAGYDRLGFNIDFCLYHQTENIVSLFLRETISTPMKNQRCIQQNGAGCHINNVDLFVLRVLNQIFVPLTEVFKTASYNVDGSLRLSTSMISRR